MKKKFVIEIEWGGLDSDNEPSIPLKELVDIIKGGDFKKFSVIVE